MIAVDRLVAAVVLMPPLFAHGAGLAASLHADVVLAAQHATHVRAKFTKVRTVSFSIRPEERMPLCPAPIAFSPDGRLLAVGDVFGRLTLLDTATWKERKRLAGHRRLVHSLTFSSDSRTLASKGDDDKIKLWEVATLRERLLVDAGNAVGPELEICPNGRLLAAGGALWDLGTGQGLPVPPDLQRWFSSFAFSPDGSMLALSRGSKVRFVSPSTRGVMKTIKTKSQSIDSIRFSRDGSVLAIGDFDGRVSLWEVCSGKIKATPHFPGRRIEGLSISGDNNYLAAYCPELHRTVVIDACTGELLKGLPANNEKFAFAPSGATLAIIGEHGVIEVFEVQSAR
jgi:WD40 repeat protein